MGKNPRREQVIYDGVPDNADDATVIDAIRELVELAESTDDIPTLANASAKAHTLRRRVVGPVEPSFDEKIMGISRKAAKRLGLT